VKRIGQRPGLFLADLQSLSSIEMLHLTLHVIELPDVRAGLPCDLALAADMQITEFSTRMRHASSLRDATDKSGFIASVIVTNKTALPFAQECSGMLAGARFAEIVDHRFQVFKGSWRIRPEVGSVGLFLAGFEHLHRRLVGV
jgi:hypothetical protein